MKIVIFGAGRHSLLVSSILSNQNFDIIGHIDIEKKSTDCNIIGEVSDLPRLVDQHNIGGGIVAIGLNYIREKIVNEVEKENKGFKWIKCVENSANIQKNVHIGEGSMIIGNSSICYGSKIGKHVIINNNSSLNHDNIFEDFSSTGPGVITGGDIIVKNYSYLGIGSVVKHGTIIGENVVVGANSFVNQNVEDNILGFGSPFKKVRSRKKDDNYL